jgi:hypothetical protein
VSAAEHAARMLTPGTPFGFTSSSLLFQRLLALLLLLSLVSPDLALSCPFLSHIVIHTSPFLWHMTHEFSVSLKDVETA